MILINWIGLYEERAYTRMNPVAAALARRAFWLQFNSDASAASNDFIPTMMNICDSLDVALPSQVDDDYITEEAELPQPAGQTSLMSGFYYISKLYKLLSQLFDMRRRDKQHVPSGERLRYRLDQLLDLYHVVITLMDDCPDSLRLNPHSDAAVPFRSDDDNETEEWLRQPLLSREHERNKSGSSTTGTNAHLVQQANIYVTQQMARSMILLYWDHLSALHQSGLEPTANPRPTFGANLTTGEEKVKVAEDLLSILKQIPTDLAAVNSFSLVIKVRYVAATLIDIHAASSRSAHTTITAEQKHDVKQAAQQAEMYIGALLRIISELEMVSILTDERDD